MLFCCRQAWSDVRAAEADEAGQESVCDHLCDWPGAAGGRVLCVGGDGAGVGAEDRHVQPQAARLRLLRAQQRPLGARKRRQGRRLHAARPRRRKVTR